MVLGRWDHARLQPDNSLLLQHQGDTSSARCPPLQDVLDTRCNGKGRYLSIQKLSKPGDVVTRILQLAEVEVSSFGCPVALRYVEAAGVGLP